MNTKETQPSNYETYTVMEFASAFNIGRDTSYSIFRRNDFPSFRIGNRFLVMRCNAIDYLSAQKNKDLRKGRNFWPQED